MLDIKSMLLTEIEGYFGSIGERPYRAGQVFRWLHSGADTFEKMTNLPLKLRERLEADFYISKPEIAERLVSGRDGTIKYLWRLADGAAVESVVMEYAHGHTVCISSQAGCRMGCAFCASALGGFARNLAPSEMIDQVMYSGLDSGKKISNVVLMGIGEPLDNFENVMRFIELINHPSGMNIGARHISISTCGLAEMIDKLAEYEIQSTLMVSLHAPDDETRSDLMPVNRGVGVDRLFEACGNYFQKTGRRVSYEYAMIDGVNDSPEHARLLSRRLRGTGSHLNLIRLSDVPERPYRGSSRERINAFTKVLTENNVNFTVRRSLGADISASCGQLRLKRPTEAQAFIDNK